MGEMIWRGLLANGKFALSFSARTREEAEAKAKIFNDTIDAWGENRIVAPPSRCVGVVEWECPETGML